MAQRVADAELVEGVGVVDRHVGDDEIGGDEQPEHVLADVALPDELAGRAAIDRDAVLVRSRSSAGRMSAVSTSSKSMPSLTPNGRTKKARMRYPFGCYGVRKGPKSSIAIWLATARPTRSSSSM